MISHALLSNAIRSPQPTHDSNFSSLFTTYYPGLPKFKRILCEGFFILSSDHTTHNFLKTSPLHCQFRQTTQPFAKSSPMPPPPSSPHHLQRIPPLLPAARHVPSTSPPYHSLALTPAYLIPSPPLPIIYRPTKCTNVMHFTFEKQVRCSGNM